MALIVKENQEALGREHSKKVYGDFWIQDKYDEIDKKIEEEKMQKKLSEAF